MNYAVTCTFHCACFLSYSDILPMTFFTKHSEKEYGSLLFSFSIAVLQESANPRGKNEILYRFLFDDDDDDDEFHHGSQAPTIHRSNIIKRSFTFPTSG